MRKVKHLTVNLAVNGATDIFWALVFVPEGYNPNALFPAGTVNGSAMYEPNQYVMNCGVVDLTLVQPGSLPVSPAILIAVTVFTLLLELQAPAVLLSMVL